MKRLPIRWKFTLWYGATLATLLIGFGLLLFFTMRQQLLARTDRQLEEELREIGLEMNLAKTVPELEEQTRKRFAEHDIYHFRIIDPAGKVFFQSETLEKAGSIENTLPDDGQSRVFDTRDLAKIGPCRLATAVIKGPGGNYVVHAATSLEPFEDDMEMLGVVLLASGPIALALGIGAGYTLARRALSPVDRMVDAANRISGTDLQQRIDVANPDDELGRLAQTFNALIDRLQRSVEEMRRFTADAAHELRTPLAVLRSEVEITLRAPRSAEEYRHALEVVAVEADRLTRLADQMLLLCRQEAGMKSIDREDVRLDALIKDVAEQFASRANDTGVTIEVKPLQRWIVPGDDIRLSQLFYNILDNAIKYTPHGGHVLVHGESREGRVQITVEDDGPGIPEEHLPHVFKRFYRVERSRNHDQGGTGLGLAIAQSVVIAHGGSIAIRNGVEHGIIVTVNLPYVRTSMADDSPAMGIPVATSR